MPANTRFCGQCGAELEPKAPAVEPAVPMSGAAWKRIALFAVLATALFVVAFLQMSTDGRYARPYETPTTPATVSQSPSMPERAVTTDCYCAPSESDAARVYLSIQRGDTAAVLGLVQRGKAFALAEGDRVKVVIDRNGMASVRVLSGYRIGERCWLLSGLLR